MTAREGDQGTWSHCGNSKPHAPHIHTFAMNEGPYTVQCNGTAEERAYSHAELMDMLERAQVSTPLSADELGKLLDGSTEPQMAETFILVRVRHEPQMATRPTPVGLIRQAIHDIVEEHELQAGDIVIFPAPQRSSLPGPYTAAIRSAYGPLKAHYEHLTAVAKSLRSTNLSPRDGNSVTPPTKERNQHMARARRALAIVQSYIERYGEYGLNYRPGPTQKKGKHA